MGPFNWASWVRQLPDMPPNLSEDLLDSSERLHFYQAEQGCLLTLRDLHMTPMPSASR